MVNGNYDLITVGGGLGGSALAKAMAERGARVLLLEREKHFRDRVRGEQMSSWGVGEARELGIYDSLRKTCGHEVRWQQAYLGDMALNRQDCIAESVQHEPQLSFYHPAMQEVLLQAAADAGADVRRGVAVSDVKPGTPPSVIVEHDGQVGEFRARLIVGADGRTSRVRKWAGFPVHRDPPQRYVAGVLFENMATLPEDTSYFRINPALGQVVFMMPQGKGRVRAYLGWYQRKNPDRLQTTNDLPRFIAESVKTGTPAEFYEGAKPAGPLATFEGADTWVEHPYRAGVALVGDAATSNDPLFGQGLSITVRSVRVLRDHLLSYNDWEAAGHAYAAAQDRDYGVVHRVTQWLGQILYEPGEEADARRARALPLLGQDSTRMPNHLLSGPDVPADDTVRTRFFGEE
jgi:2-polyprenyl-6-methoxyphenol hydroxylase-like FAD-dependent oxidoreductase